MDTVKDLLLSAREHGLLEAILENEKRENEMDRETILNKMRENLDVMRQSAEAGLNPELRSVSGMTGGGASRYRSAVLEGRTPGGKTVGEAASRALAIAEYNAAMGRIVAAPTAGACGILPGVLLTAGEKNAWPDERLSEALVVAAAFGKIIAVRASISGARGGCQAECGSASAMAAAALTYLYGGTPEQCADACSFALMSILGLVCDPVGGLVEVPCVYRNVSGTAIAFTSADLTLSGIRCPIPCDEMIEAMRAVGDQLPASLRETGEGGCAACPSARTLCAAFTQKSEAEQPYKSK